MSGNIRFDERINIFLITRAGNIFLLLFIFLSIGNNRCMNIYNCINKFKNNMLVPFGVAAIIFSFKVLFDFLSFKTDNDIISFKNLSSCFEFFVPLIIAFFTTFYLAKGRKTFKALFVLFCTFVFYSLFSQSKSYFFAILISLLAYYCYENLSVITASLLIIASSLIFAVLCTYLYDYYNNLIMVVAAFVSDKGNISSALFGFINTLLSPFDFKSFENMFYFKSFGSSIVVDNKVISGAINIFNNNVKSQSIITYLSGHSYLIFLIVGVFSSLVKELNGFEKLIFIVLFTSAVLCGNINLFMLFIFLESPYLFLSMCAVASLCYFCASIVKISVGFSFGGGIFEILINADKYIYLITISVVFVAIGYFVTKYFYEKYGISSLLNIYIPNKLKKTVSSLGGVQNIIRFNDASIEVRNPKLVDEIALDCEIKENNIKINKSIIDDLKEYIA